MGLKLVRMEAPGLQSSSRSWRCFELAESKIDSSVTSIKKSGMGPFIEKSPFLRNALTTVSEGTRFTIGVVLFATHIVGESLKSEPVVESNSNRRKKRNWAWFDC